MPAITLDLPSAPPQYLSYADVASGLKVSERSLMRWIKAGSVPSPVYLGAMARFPLDYVQKVLTDGVRIPGTYDVAPSVRSRTTAPAIAEPTRSKPAKKKAAGKPKKTAPKPAAKKTRGAKRSSAKR